MACMPGAMADIEDFRALVTRLRTEKGMTLEDLAYEARRRARGREGVSLSLIQKRMAPRNRRAPSPELLEAVAAALEVPPETFPEYRLYLARRLFDQEEAGSLAAALANLEKVHDLLALNAEREPLRQERSELDQIFEDPFEAEAEQTKKARRA